MCILDRIRAQTLAASALIAVFLAAIVVSPYLPYTTLHAQQVGPGGVPGGNSGGAVSSVFGRTGAVVAATGDYTATQVTDAAVTNAANTYTASGAASTPAVTYTGMPYSGGTGATTYPYWYYDCSGATQPTSFNTSGTIIGENICSTSTPYFIDFHVNGGTSAFHVNANGGIFSASTITGDVYLNNAGQTTVNCSTSGSLIVSEPQQGTSYKLISIYADACNGTASYTYPTAFLHMPQVLSQNNAALATSVSTTAVTITGSASTGFLDLDGW